MECNQLESLESFTRKPQDKAHLAYPVDACAELLHQAVESQTLMPVLVDIALVLKINQLDKYIGLIERSRAAILLE